MSPNLHRNKRSIALDLKSDGGRAIGTRLISQADVFVTNMRHSALTRLSLDYNTLADDHPALVYVEAHGFALESGRAEEPAYDDTIQALTGMPRLSEQVGTGVFFLPTLVADKVSGLGIVQAVLAALVHRGITGEGQRVEVPMFDSVLAFLLTEHIGLAAFPGGVAGYSRVLTANRGPHKTVDGWLAMLPYLDRHWRDLFDESGCGELLGHPSHADMASRLRDADFVYGQLKMVVFRRTTAEWLETCRRIDVPVAEVPSLDEIIADDELNLGVVSMQDHPVVGSYRAIAQLLRFYATPTVSAPRPAPLIGQDADEVLSELGIEAIRIEALYETGAVRRPRYALQS